jgi:hypothetical protein
VLTASDVDVPIFALEYSNILSHACMQFAGDLQHVQRVALQRLLTRTVDVIPYSELLAALEHLVGAKDMRGQADVSMPADHIPPLLFTDCGVALVAQLCHRIVQRRTPRFSAPGADSAACFVPLCGEATTSLSISSGEREQEARIVHSLLSCLPAVFDWIEYTRTHLGAVPCSTPVDISPHLAAQLGAAVDRHGCKVLALNLVALLEYEMLSWVLHSVAAAGFQPCKPAQELAQEWGRYDEVMKPCTSFSSIPVADSALSEKDAVPLSNEQQALRSHCNSVTALYNCLEKRLLQQHDCTLVTAGMRCLHHLLAHNPCPPGSESGTTVLATQRTATVAWGCMRAFYPEHTHLALHLLDSALPGEDIPGMDENWPTLARAVTAQPALHAAVHEVEQCTTKKTVGVSKLLQSCFSTKRDFSASKTASSVLQDDQMAAASYRQFWLCWWAAERAAERVYGVANLVRDVFKMVYEEGRTAAEARHLAEQQKSRKKLKAGTNQESDCDSSESEALPMPAKQKRLGAPEQMLTKEYAGKDKQQKFPHLSEATIVFHLELTLPLLPALFLLSKPSCTVAKDKSSSPYVMFNNTAMLFVWVLDRWSDILTEHHEQLRLLLQVAPMLVKVFRATLPAVDVAVTRAVQWRNVQPEPVQSLDAAPVVDIGSISFLKAMVGWAHRCAYATRDFAEAFRDTIILPGALQVSASLHRDMPAIVKQAEQLLARLNAVATAHSFNITVPRPSAIKGSAGVSATGSAALSKIGDDCTHARMIQFLTRHHAALVTPLQAECLLADILTVQCVSDQGGAATSASVGAVREPTTAEPQIASGYDSDGHVSDEDLEFAAWTGGAQSAGWGLYAHDQSDDDLQSSSTPTSENYSLAEFSVSDSMRLSDDGNTSFGSDDEGTTAEENYAGVEGEFVAGHGRFTNELDGFDVDLEGMEE